MDKNEFLQRALIAVGAALVKCYDERYGIIGNEATQYELSLNAQGIVSQLLDRADDLEIID